ncbi:MAG: ATP-binding protein, partial [Bacteroidales bacterium]
WGKSSLVYYAARECNRSHPKIRFIMLDLFNVRTEEQFYELLAKETLRIFSSQIEDIIKTSRNFLGRFLPKVTFSPSPEIEFELSLDWEEIKREPDDILQLPEKLAAQKKCRLVVCIDEFQNIAYFEDHLSFQKKLRSSWQHHKYTSYCLYGSKKNMMMNVFSNYSMPFYKFGDIIFLQKIPARDWYSFIQEQFRKTKKKINSEALHLITELADNHPHYVQQLAQLSWLRTADKCDRAVVQKAFEGLIQQLSMLFYDQVDNLSNTQINFLKAVSDKTEHLSSKETLKKYRLGTSANIQRIKQALINKEIIDTSPGGIQLLDPVFGFWLKNEYFKRR